MDAFRLFFKLGYKIMRYSMQVNKIVFTVFLLISITAMAQKEAPPFKKFTYTTKSDTMPYGILEPVKIESNEKYPLVIFLHGAGERGNDNSTHLKFIQILYSRNVLMKYPSFVLAPQCPLKESWSDFMSGKPFSQTPTRPMQLCLEILEKVIKEYPVDPSRIYVTGLSMGGFGTWDLITRFPNRFAAAVPICGGGDEKKVSLIKHIPIWAFHGALDGTVPPQKSRRMIEALWSAGASPGYTEYPNVEHNSWYKAYKDPHLPAWLFQQKLPPDKP
jgi:predicted peptidase